MYFIGGRRWRVRPIGPKGYQFKDFISSIILCIGRYVIFFFFFVVSV